MHTTLYDAVIHSHTQSHLLGDLTEVPIPLRFIYLLLGPEQGMVDYHEVGRAMATLMSDTVRKNNVLLECLYYGTYLHMYMQCPLSNLAFTSYVCLYA